MWKEKTCIVKKNTLMAHKSRFLTCEKDNVSIFVFGNSNQRTTQNNLDYLKPSLKKILQILRNQV